ncbi:MAG: hypothetical protein J6S83_02825 [Lachnospiraceae bacterium]|nr:hypothetical protein [Lachnospiraceae bacterium]
MTPDRYAKDYILDEQTDERGQVSFQYNYHGPVYKLTADLRLKRRTWFLTFAAWLLFIAAMLPRSHAMHVWYVSLPFAFTAIPLWLMARIALFLRQPGETDTDRGNSSQACGQAYILKRKEADLINNTWPAAAGSILVLPAICVIGQVICLLRGKWILPGDALFSLAAAALGAAGFFLFRKRPAAELISEGSVKPGQTEQESNTE